jgi:hypothetical protein
MTKDELIKQHQFSYKGIFYAYDWKEIKKSKSFRYSIILTLVCQAFRFFGILDSFENFQFWVDKSVSIFPSMLGFNLGGYALIIGFGNSELMKSLTTVAPNKKVSSFQMLSAVFAFSILLQLLSFIFAFLSDYFIKLGFSTNSLFLSELINTFFSSILILISLWSLLFIPILVFNIFSFGQAYHFSLTRQRIEDEQNGK